MQSVEDFKKDIAQGGETLARLFEERVTEAEGYTGDKNTLLWHTYTRNRDLQKQFIEEVQHAVSMPELAPEVLGMRYRLWQEFVQSVEALDGAPKQEVPAPERQKEEEEQELTIYEDKHPSAPRADELAVAKPAQSFTRIKPKPQFAQPKPVVKKVAVQTEQKPVPAPEQKPEPPKPAPKKMEVPKPKKVEQPAPKTAATDADVAKVRQTIIERVIKNAQGFLDGIFGSLKDEDAGLAKIEGLRLSDIIEIEKLSPDAHTAKLDDLNVSQKEWEAWIDWVNESNRVVSATVSATLGEYVNQVARHIARKG